MAKKSDVTRDRLLKGALYCLAHYGDRGTTFQKIADHCGVSQPLVVKYFKSRDEIFPIILDFIFEQAREQTQESLKKVGTPEEKLRNYLEVSVQIFRQQMENSKIYLMFYYMAGIDEKYRKLNTAVKKEATARIVGILNEGVERKDFIIRDIELMAKTIHNSLTGMLLNIVTEDPFASDQKLLKALIDTFLLAIKKK